MDPEDSYLRVRRSVLVPASPREVWSYFASREAMQHWWGIVRELPEAGRSDGQWLDVYEPCEGGRIMMSVMLDGVRTSYGGRIVRFVPREELRFENDWDPPVFEQPSLVSIRLVGVDEGTVVELHHYGFERTGADAGETHLGYESGWGTTQLAALRALFSL